eukprot:847727-Amphidinium_carterae.1
MAPTKNRVTGYWIPHSDSVKQRMANSPRTLLGDGHQGPLWPSLLGPRTGLKTRIPGRGTIPLDTSMCWKLGSWRPSSCSAGMIWVLFPAQLDMQLIMPGEPAFAQQTEPPGPSPSRPRKPGPWA